MYLEILKTAFEKLTAHAGFDPEKLMSLSREDALRSFVSQQLRPLLFSDEITRYIRVFAWEAHMLAKIFLKFMATHLVSYLTAAVDIEGRFLPPGTPKRIALCGAIWLMGQCDVFLQNRELFTKEPTSRAMSHSWIS